jgi:hypothetical protein
MPVRVLVLVLLASCGGDRAFPYLQPRGVAADPAHGFDAMPEAVREEARLQPRTQRAIDAVPARLTASDGTGLAMERLRARGVVEGPLAFTELEMTFRNPTDRQLEGRFSLAVPPGAAISRFAMRRGVSWVEAEVVERRRGQDVYESHLHRQVDPALLEHEAGNRFAARVFPIAADESVAILVSYSHELVDAREPYRVPLVGLPRLEVLDVSARVGDLLVRRSEHDVVPVRDFVVPVDAQPDGLVAGEHVALRVAPDLDARAEPFGALTVLLDTSASVGRQLPDRAADLAALARALGTARLAVVAFDQTADLVYDGPAAGFGAREVDRLLLRRALGASNLEAALARAGRLGAGRVLLVSDGVATAGAIEVAAMVAAMGRGGARAERLDAMTSGGGDPALLRTLAARGGRRAGVVLRADAGVDDWMKRLRSQAAAPIEVAVAGATWVWPERLEGMQPGDRALIYARVPRAGKTARVELRGGAHGGATLALAAATAGPLLEREAAQAEIDRLAASGGHEAEIIELSLRHRVLTPETALLVLENDDDYRRFGLDRNALADLMTVDATGLRLLRRGGFAPAPVVPQARERRRNGRAGEITGTVFDHRSGEVLAGVTMVATSPVLQGTQASITGADGRYTITSLPPGTYEVTAYYADVTVLRRGIEVVHNKVTPVSVSMDTSQVAGEVIEIRGTTTVDTTSRSNGVKLSQDFSRGIPVPGRSFEATLGAAAGSWSEPVGVTFSGSTSLDNRYFLDGTTAQAPEPDHGPRTPYAGRLLDVMRHLERGQRDEALVLALRWRTESPWDILALVALGEALEARGAAALAARAYGSIVDEAPSRPEMRRFAAGRLARLGAVAAALAVDVLERAVALRPDQPSGVRQLAYALLRAGRHRRAIEVLLAALNAPDDPRGRLQRARELLASDAGLIAADWLRRAPAQRRAIERMLDGQGILVPLEPSVRFVVTWENDATDIDLHVAPADQRFSRATGDAVTTGLDIADGWGPEHAEVDGRGPAAGYHLWIDYAARAMMGTAFGQLDIVEHDGGGLLRVETRPFVVMVEHAEVDLGGWKR